MEKLPGLGEPLVKEGVTGELASSGGATPGEKEATGGEDKTGERKRKKNKTDNQVPPVSG